MAVDAELEAVAAQVRVCPLCDLSLTRTHAVPGEGLARERILLVGEAPGRNEDETGRPFCGAAGKNLDLGLSAARLGRDDVFVTSIVKCRPPGNRDPATTEKATCRPYLARQIAALRPRVIVALGRHALSGLVEPMPTDFAAVAGTFLATPDGIPVFVSLHPAAIIYRQKWKADYLEHWTRFGDWARENAPSPGDSI